MPNQVPSNIVQRPKRWDEPFSNEISENEIDWVMSSPHFRLMEVNSFPASLSLKNILKNDCKIRHYKKNELIVYDGAYINFAYLILSGKAMLVSSPGIDSSTWGHRKKQQPSVFSSLKKWFTQSRLPEVREHVSTPGDNLASNVNSLFISNVHDLLATTGVEIVNLSANDIFGESAVLGRNVMSNTVIAESDLEVLEIRWQGLRDICKWSASFKSFVDIQYRERGLYEYLLSVPLFQHVEKKEIRALANIAIFEVHGEFEWQSDFQKITKQTDIDEGYDRLIKSEPLIAEEGDHPDGLLLIRNGFARVSCRINHGNYTLGHLAAGDLFGLKEIYDSWNSNVEKPLTSSIRALGYTDVIRIPTIWLENNIFQSEHMQTVQFELERSLSYPNESVEKQPVDREFTEFLVENRFINGTQTMMIDLERCIRCDDCVTACSNAHDGNPRFNRHGASFDQYMIANACMHCEDPVCMIGCPTGAIHRSEDGVVTINDATCIGCSSCANNCPYDNIQMAPVRDKTGKLFTDEQAKPILKATKCDLCSTIAGGPACERACSHDALVRIDVKDISKLADWVNR